MSQLLLSIMGAVAEFERAHIREHQLEGIKNAKAKKLYKGRKPKLTYDPVHLIYEKFRKGGNKTKTAEECKISREILYKHTTENIRSNLNQRWKNS